MPADYGENAPDSLNKGLVAARFDGVVPEEADAVLTRVYAQPHDFFSCPRLFQEKIVSRLFHMRKFAN